MSGEGGAFERRIEADPPHGSPELAPGHDDDSLDGRGATVELAA
jgi:hypothetical protein